MGDLSPEPAASDPWREQSALIRTFLERRPLYEKLCSEVAYSLEHSLKTENIDLAAVTSRAKELASLLEKIERKTYEGPLDDITDFAGVRIVYLYPSDFDQIERILKRDFEIVEKVDHLADKGSDRFGYSAPHFLVRIGDRFSGARYDELKDLTCEVQVRTALQDAWAILSHQLVYKRESTIPQKFRRAINAVAGSLESADNQFEYLRRDREQYLEELETAATDPDKIHDQEVDVESVMVYLKTKFPTMKTETYEGHVEFLLREFPLDLYPRVSDLDAVIERTKKAREAYQASRPFNSAAGILGVSMGFGESKYRYRKSSNWHPEALSLLEKHEHLVDPS